MKKITLISSVLTVLFFTGCGTTSKNITSVTETDLSDLVPETEVFDLTEADNSQKNLITEPEEEKWSQELTLLFGGDIMAHSINYQISTYSKIWRDIKDEILPADLAFANIEAPIDTTKSASTYPNFNMTQKYVQAAVDAGFDVFSLCNNHTNDQGLTGIKETIKTTERLTKAAAENGHKIYFSGLKNTSEDSLTYNIIETKGWKILFLPITELLNRPSHSEYINFISPNSTDRENFIKLCKELRENNPCDLFIISVHTAEPEYTRVITEKQDEYYKSLLDSGADIVWANHAHIIKDRKLIVDSEKKTTKLIMYANGNTISGQRTKPELNSKNPVGERDNTGDGLLYRVTFKKENKEASPFILKAKPVFITTYINTAGEFVIKKLDQSFVDYLYEVPRNSWAEYIKRRITINKDATKDLIEWQ